ncbi:MAG: nucleotidyltransferase domain-containing protein [Candidatus Hermodarchaeota archaeon]
MFDLQKKFDAALKDTVKEWKGHDKVKGIFVYGSFVKGTLTATSDLDLGVIWDDPEPPAQLFQEHKGIRIDISFLTPKVIEDVFEGKTSDALRIAGLIGILRNAKVVHDTKGKLKKWQKRAADFVWSEEAIDSMKDEALLSLNNASKSAELGDTISAIHELRSGLFDLGRVIVMKNNYFSIMKPSEVLTEIRLLDPVSYPLFLRTFKLKGMEEEDLMDTLEEVRGWIEIAEGRFSEGTVDDYAMELLTRAQREYHGARNCTLSGDYELAVLEMRRAVDNIGRALLALTGHFEVDQTNFVQALKENEPVFYENILVQHGAFDFTDKGIERGISEAHFIAQRL